ncbi:hypothetical protein [Candidatus Borreliella tachyglossi]|uniref:hypothetical protein n=1 Tax=Candidatus Borreliella tachyglossi TaxID=1964448 RepID=UPI0040421F16
MNKIVTTIKNSKYMSKIDELKFNLEFLYRNFFVILGVVFLFIFNLFNSYNGFVAYSAHNENLQQQLLSLAFTIVVIVVPTIIFQKMYLLKKEYRLQKLENKNTTMSPLDIVVVCLLLVVAVITQLVSTWGSYESFFKMTFSGEYRKLEKPQHELSNSLKNNIKQQENTLRKRIDSLEKDIEKNKSRIIENRGKYLNLDYTFKTKKKEYLDDIEQAELENKNLLLEIASCYKEIDLLASKFYQAENTIVSKNNLYGIHALIFASPIASLDKTNLRYAIAYMLLLCSAVLDIIFCIFTFQLSSKYRLDYASKLNSLSSDTNSSKNHNNFSKIKKRNSGKFDINAIPVDLYKSLDFIVKNLESDNKTLKKIEDIASDTGKTIYFVRKEINKLVKHNFIFKKHRNLLLNVDLTCQLVNEINNNNGDNSEVSSIKDELKKNCGFITMFANVSLLTRMLN